MRTKTRYNKKKLNYNVPTNIISYLDASFNNKKCDLSITPDLTIYNAPTIDFSNNITNLLNRTNTILPNSSCFISDLNKQNETPKHLLDELINNFVNEFTALNFKSSPPLNIDPNYDIDFAIGCDEDEMERCKKKQRTNDYNQYCPQTTEFIHKIINVNIDSIDDLINLINKYPIVDNVKYNIDIKLIHKIKQPLNELNSMIGMKTLKNNVLDQILYFSQDLHKTNNEGDFMHTVIYGPPGTGKTELAKILGKIYSNLGVLSKQTFKKATRSDLIAGYLGQTAIKTNEMITSCLGGVLFIDEAYALGNPEQRDSFAKECIDTLCEALSEHKSKLMVIIAGYENELQDCFFKYNQGLDSRFIWRFKTDEYTAEDLMNIFIKKVKDNGWSIHNKTTINKEWFEEKMPYFKYYGRDMETLFIKSKISHGRRVFCLPIDEKTKLTIEDLDKGYKLFLLNDEVKRRKDDKEIKKDIKYSMYN
jgi:DNA replication protein DnaC